MHNHLDKLSSQPLAKSAALRAGLAALVALSIIACSPESDAQSTPEATSGNAAATGTTAAAQSFDGYSDIVLGNKDAPIKVIEYASMTCGHCAAFHKDVFKDFKKNYVDTGKASYVLRNFVLNGPDLVASMLARCAPQDRFYAYIDLFLTRQDAWIQGWKDMPQPAENATMTDVAFAAKMDQFVRPAGMSEEKFRACLADPQVQKDLLRLQEEGRTQMSVTGTPTLFINGVRYEGGHTYAEFDEALKKATK